MWALTLDIQLLENRHLYLRRALLLWDYLPCLMIKFQVLCLALALWHAIGSILWSVLALASWIYCADALIVILWENRSSRIKHRVCCGVCLWCNECWAKSSLISQWPKAFLDGFGHSTYFSSTIDVWCHNWGSTVLAWRYPNLIGTHHVLSLA